MQWDSNPIAGHCKPYFVSITYSLRPPSPKPQIPANVVGSIPNCVSGCYFVNGFNQTSVMKLGSRTPVVDIILCMNYLVPCFAGKYKQIFLLKAHSKCSFITYKLRFFIITFTANFIFYFPAKLLARSTGH